MLDWNEYSTLHQTPENIRGKKRVISLMVYLPCHCFRLTKICWILFRFVLLFYAIQHKECLEWFILFCSYFSVYEFNVTRIYMDRGKQSERDSWLFWWRMKSTRIPIAEKENGWSFFLNQTRLWTNQIIYSVSIPPPSKYECVVLMRVSVRVYFVGLLFILFLSGELFII